MTGIGLTTFERARAQQAHQRDDGNGFAYVHLHFQTQDHPCEPLRPLQRKSGGCRWTCKSGPGPPPDLGNSGDDNGDDDVYVRRAEAASACSKHPVAEEEVRPQDAGGRSGTSKTVRSPAFHLAQADSRNPPM